MTQARARYSSYRSNAPQRLLLMGPMSSPAVVVHEVEQGSITAEVRGG